MAPCWIHKKKFRLAPARRLRKPTRPASKTALITGRNVDAVRFILDAIELSGPMVGCGGAFIYDPSSAKTLEIHTLPMDKTIELVHLCREFEAVLYLEYLHYAIYEKTNNLMEQLNSLHEYKPSQGSGPADSTGKRAGQGHGDRGKRTSAG